MVNFVIKKDGSKVPFDAQKLKSSIIAACEDAGMEDDQKNNVAQEVSSSVEASLSDKDQVQSTEIKSMILAELDAVAPEAAQAWRAYDQTKGQ